ncbi:MAG: hypothetical protein JNK11_02855 [Alphaproteobacteria bacterium]|nr:hypothetical protein [Alphaproteobacteria bacterium]
MPSAPPASRPGWCWRSWPSGDAPRPGPLHAAGHSALSPPFVAQHCENRSGAFSSRSGDQRRRDGLRDHSGSRIPAEHLAQVSPVTSALCLVRGGFWPTKRVRLRGSTSMLRSCPFIALAVSMLAPLGCAAFDRDPDILLIGPMSAPLHPELDRLSAGGDEAVLARLRGRAVRDGDLLTLRLDNGETRQFRDRLSDCESPFVRRIAPVPDRKPTCSRARLVDFLDPAGLFVVHFRLADRGTDWFGQSRLIDSRSGRSAIAFVAMDLSPGHRLGAFVDPRFAGGGGKVEIASRGTDGWSMDLELRTEPFHRLRLQQWLQDEGMLLSVETFDPSRIEQEFARPVGTIRVHRSGARWTVGWAETAVDRLPAVVPIARADHAIEPSQAACSARLGTVSPWPGEAEWRAACASAGFPIRTDTDATVAEGPAGRSASYCPRTEDDDLAQRLPHVTCPTGTKDWRPKPFGDTTAFTNDDLALLLVDQIAATLFNGPPPSSALALRPFDRLNDALARLKRIEGIGRMPVARLMAFKTWALKQRGRDGEAVESSRDLWKWVAGHSLELEMIGVAIARAAGHDLAGEASLAAAHAVARRAEFLAQTVNRSVRLVTFEPSRERVRAIIVGTLIDLAAGRQEEAARLLWPARLFDMEMSRTSRGYLADISWTNAMAEMAGTPRRLLFRSADFAFLDAVLKRIELIESETIPPARTPHERELREWLIETLGENWARRISAKLRTP